MPHASEPDTGVEAGSARARLATGSLPSPEMPGALGSAEARHPRRVRLQVLLSAALELSREHELDAVLRQIVDGVASIAGARYAALAVYDESGAHPPPCRSGRGCRSDVPCGRPAPRGRSASGGGPAGSRTSGDPLRCLPPG